VPSRFPDYLINRPINVSTLDQRWRPGTVERLKTIFFSFDSKKSKKQKQIECIVKGSDMKK